MPRSTLKPRDDVSARRERGIVTEGTVRLGTLMAWPRVLAGFGVDAAALFAPFGLSPADFDDPETVVPMSVLGRALRASVAATGCDHVGVLIGQESRISSLGAVGFLMQSCPTVGDALRELEGHLQVQDRAAVLSLEIEGRHAALGYLVTARGVEAIDQIYCLVALVGRNIMRALCGNRWRLLEVRLPIARPANVGPLREAIGAPLRFNAERLELVFPASDLQRPLATAAPLLHRMMTERIRELVAASRTDLVDRVRRQLRTLVFLPHRAPPVIAGRLGMSLRTLNRRLADEGTSVRRLSDEVARDAACQLLASTAKSAGEIGLLLGYSDASAFTRAFRRWCGTAPTQWRETAARRDSPKRRSRQPVRTSPRRT